ncbi:MAG: type II secretion system minor pseudopilin GspJ [Gammaproteobacteria bacterium]
MINIKFKFNNSFGFTLIEMMIAIFLFSIVSVMAYGGINYVLKGQNYLQSSSNQLKDMQLTFRYFEKDINQMINRSVRNQYQDLQPSFVGNEDKVFSFTHAGWRNPANLTRSKMQRVSYELDENILKRHTWGQLDGAIAEEFFTTDLLEGVESIQLRYLDQANQWQSTWPPLNNSTVQQSGIVQQFDIPRALELTIKMENMEEIKRLFAAPATT